MAKAVFAATLFSSVLFLPGCPSCSEDPAGPTEVVCEIGRAGGSCTVGPCTLIVPPGALDARTTVELSVEPPLEPALVSEILGGQLCVVGPQGLVLLGVADLRMTYDPALLPSGSEPSEIIGVEEQDAALALSGTYLIDSAAQAVALSILGSGRFGLSLSPSGPVASLVLGGENLLVYDDATFLRNVTSRPIWAAFYDGERLFVGSGARVLVYDGIPTSPVARPDLILGRPSLEAESSMASASNFTGHVTGLWSDGTRLVVATGNRVLVWLNMPEETYAPADVVLGQPSFGVDLPNNGGVSATSLNQPDDVFSDGTHLIVADSQNHRWLLWNDFPVLSGTPADVVIGQPDFDVADGTTGAIPAFLTRGALLAGGGMVLTSTWYGNVAYGLSSLPATNNAAADYFLGTPLGFAQVSETSFRLPSGLSSFGAGGIALRDSEGGRVAVWNDLAAAAGAPFDLVIGRPHAFTGGTSIGGVSASTITDASLPAGVYADDTRLLVPDRSRLLVWDALPSYDFAPADRVLFAGSSVSAEVAVDYRRIDSTSLARPARVASDGTMLAIADSANNRVVLYDTSALATGAAPVAIVGQPDATSFLPNRGGLPSSRTLSAPEGVDLRGGIMAVADTHNHRVLLWNAIPTTAEEPADVVLGAPDFTTALVNGGLGDLDGDGDPDADGAGFFYPTDVALGADSLVVADRFNHRVLVFSPVPTVSGTSATTVIGQPDLGANDVNRGAGFFTPVPDGLNQPSGISIEPGTGRLIVADEENNRVLFFPALAGSLTPAEFVVGQPDAFTVSNPNFYSGAVSGGLPLVTAPTAGSLRRPYDAIASGGALWIADTGHNRVAVYLTVPSASGATADLFLGQPGADSSTSNASGVGAASLAEPTGLAAVGTLVAVADRGNHRVLLHDLAIAPAATFRPADAVLGQAGLGVNQFNAGAGTLALLARPLGVAWDGARLFAADTDHHRVVVYDGIPGMDDVPPLTVMGQDSTYGVAPNGGGPAAANTLHSPHDVFSDGTYVVVADTGNHRVLVFDAATAGPGAAAILVLGQPDFTSVSPNRGAGVGSPAADSLFSPRSVFLDATGLYVADTGNNRVLVWSSLPGSSGAPADRVLGQPDFDVNSLNGGLPAPGASTLAGPEDLLVAAGALWVADALNNRVLRYDLDAPTGAAATAVLGQMDYVSRSALGASGVLDATTMSYPSGLATDDRYLFVADLADNRVLVFPFEDVADGAAALTVLGQPDFVTPAVVDSRAGLASPARIAAFRRPFNETVLIVPDSGKDRLVVFDGITRIRELLPTP